MALQRQFTSILCRRHPRNGGASHAGQAVDAHRMPFGNPVTIRQERQVKNQCKNPRYMLGG